MRNTEVKMRKIGTKDNLADMLTKVFPLTKYNALLKAVECYSKVDDEEMEKKGYGDRSCSNQGGDLLSKSCGFS